MRLHPQLSVLVLVMFVGLTGCGGGKQNMPSPAPPALTAILVSPVGPGIMIGATQQFTAMGQYKDGSTKDLTTTAMWSSSSSAIASVNSGLAQAIAAGFCTITATVNNISGSTALTVTSPTPTPIALTGEYTFTIKGVDSRGPQFYAGVFHADGNGNLSGVEDANTGIGVVTNASLTGTYNLFSDGRGDMTLKANGLPSHSFRFILVANGQIGKMIEFDAAGNSIGGFEKQDTAALSTSVVNGTYVFRLEGSNSVAKAMAKVGIFTADGSGNINNGTEDVNDQSKVTSNIPFAGGYSVGSNGRGTAMFSTSSGTTNFAIYIVSANKLNLVEMDSGTGGTVLAGTAEMQTGQPFSSASMGAGGYVHYLEHAPGQTRGTFDKVGHLSLDGSGKVTGGVQDEDIGNLLNSVSGGSYNVAANGRGTLNETATSGTHNFIFYILSSTKMYVLETDGGAAVGSLEAQTAGPTFTNAALSGIYGFTASEVGETQTGISVRLVADGAGHLTGTGDLSINGVQTAVVLNATCTVDVATGRVTVTLANSPVGAQSFIFYIVSGSRAIVLGVDPDVDGTLDLQ